MSLSVNMHGKDIPKDVLNLILKNLMPEALVKVCQVCRAFNVLASQDSLFSSRNLRDTFPDSNYIVPVEIGLPYVNKADYVALKRMESQVEDGRGLTFMPLFGTSIVAFTNGIFKGSRKKSVEERKQIVKNLRCEVPTTLAARAFGRTRYRGHPEPLSANRTTLTLCVDEKRNNSTGKTIGLISHIGSLPKETPIDLEEDTNRIREEFGVAGMRQLKVRGA